jgi:hypothetical protein
MTRAPAPIAQPFPSVATKTSDMPLRCKCGHVRGVARNISRSAGLRFVCYCKDCQAFARLLDRLDVLDTAGGTDIFQMPPGRLELCEGVDALKCVRFSDKVLRWYTGCCLTPIANTPAVSGFPIIGLIHVFMDHTADGRSRDEALGPLLCSLHERSALNPLPLDGPGPTTAGIFLRRLSLLFVWWARGLARPTPFFDERTNAPRVTPHTILPNEGAAL